jgi:putative SOS response-associated peptidase YedK
MCGRFTLLAHPPIAERFGLHLFADDERLVPRFNIAPSQDIPVSRCSAPAAVGRRRRVRGWKSAGALACFG